MSSMSSFICFITSLAIASSFIGIVNPLIFNAEHLAIAKTYQSEEKLSARIDVIHVTSNDQVFIYVQNTGTKEFSMNQTQVMIDGGWMEIYSLNLLNSNGDFVWNPHEVLKISIDRNLSPGWHVCKVFVEGISSPKFNFKKV